MQTHVTASGRITIPVALRRELGIKNGTRIQVELDERAKRLVLTPITREYIHHLRGKYKGKGLLKALIAEKKWEKSL